MQQTKKILIVDDTPQNLELLSLMVSRMDYVADQAMNGERALEKVKADEYDCLLLDVMMPGMDGIEVCTIMKNSPELKDIPVIIVTALPEHKVREQAEQAGADALMYKPVRFQELSANLDKCLNAELL